MRLLGLLLLFCACLQAEETKGLVTLPAGQIHEGDYFAYGGSIEISGTVRGDVYVAGGQIFIDGTVEGDVLAVGASVVLSGEVTNNVRVIAGQTSLGGTIGYNATLLAGDAQLGPSAKIGGNLVCVAANLDLASLVGNDVTLIVSFARIASHIKHNLLAYVGQMRLTSKAEIGGNVEYRSASEARIDAAAKIGGQLIHHPSMVQHLFEGHWMQGLLLGSKLAALLMNFFYTLITGIILLRFFPEKVEASLHALSTHPWKAFGCGLLLLVLLPLLSLLLLMTILGVPFALALIAMNVIGFYSGKIFSVLWVSNKVLPRVGLKKGRLSTFSVGLVLYFALAQIPFFGIALSLAALLFGLGAAVIGYGHSRK